MSVFCKIEGCKKLGKSRAKGFCFMHYSRIRKHGDPNKVLPMGIGGWFPRKDNDVLHDPTTGRTLLFMLCKDRPIVGILDTEDYHRYHVGSYRWSVQKNPTKKTAYIVGHHPSDHHGQRVRLHRLLMPGIKLVDHEDRNGLNCCRSNLRSATTRQNGLNRGKNRRGITSKYIGINQRASGKFRARLTLANGRRLSRDFATEIEAALWRDEQAIKHYKSFAVLNFPQEKNDEKVA